ncbi:MAG TPA: transcription antitermination factor NusB [Desulfotomaculum sp.]|nr:transcription antitermination factor NusB [Desulfotomaculum sp.]HCJ79453.1 transcription antitermination factor NusB [Desulfotomaculum sp.]
MSRKQARELAFLVLFQMDVGQLTPAKAVFHTIQELKVEPREEEKEFICALVNGTWQYLADIDQVIALLSQDWQLNRLGKVDLNIMRLALFEIFFREDIPPGVSVNEAVELAKTYGSQESSRFVNGILGKIVQNIAFYHPLKNKINP